MPSEAPLCLSESEKVASGAWSSDTSNTGCLFWSSARLFSLYDDLGGLFPRSDRAADAKRARRQIK